MVRNVGVLLLGALFLMMFSEVQSGVVLSCLENLDSGRILAPLHFVDSSKYMASHLSQVAAADGLIDKVFRTLRIDDSQTGTFINTFQDKNTDPLGESSDVCGGNTFILCRPGASDDCAVWNGATVQGGGDPENDQFGAIHLGTQAISNDPSSWRILIILYTNTRPHLPSDSPAGFSPVPSTGGYDCQSSQYVSVAQLNDRLVGLDNAPIIAIVNPSDVDYYEDLLSDLTVPYAVRGWGSSKDATMTQLYGAIDSVVCGEAAVSGGKKWSEVERRHGNVGLNATNVVQTEKGRSEEFGKEYGLAMQGNQQYLRKYQYP